MKGKIINNTTTILLFIIFLVFCNLSTCLASGGSQPLSNVINHAAWIVKAKVINVKKIDKQLGYLHIKIKTVETLKGNIKDKSLLLNFKIRAYSSYHGKIKKWYMLPNSGKEIKIKKDETWFFFSYFSKKNSDGFINIFRAEPTNQESKIRDLLKSKVK